MKPADLEKPRGNWQRFVLRLVLGTAASLLVGLPLVLLGFPRSPARSIAIAVSVTIVCGPELLSGVPRRWRAFGWAALLAGFTICNEISDRVLP